MPEGCLGISVTGGFVYRGAHKAWDGAYIFGDWSKSFAERDGQLFVATKGGDGKWTMDHMEVTNMEGKLPYVLAFAQDQAGEVYRVDLGDHRPERQPRHDLQDRPGGVGRAVTTRNG